MSSHHIRFVRCSFWFYIKNTICCECDCKYSTINVVGLMLAYLLFEEWPKNNMLLDLWVYLFPLSTPVPNYLKNYKYELHLLRDLLAVAIQLFLLFLKRICTSFPGLWLNWCHVNPISSKPAILHCSFTIDWHEFIVSCWSPSLFSIC